MDLTIIIPVYNVEEYLDDCIESVLCQKTSYLYDVVIVNDCSLDNSSLILDKYKNHKLVKIINHTLNQGVAAARNTGLKDLHSNYVMFVDSDDILPENTVEDMLEKAYRFDADIVQGSYYDVDVSGRKVIGKTFYADCVNVPPNGVMSGMPWGKVYKAKLFQKVCFPEKYRFEDTIITALVSHLADTIVTISNIVYYYRQTPNGIVRTSKGNPKSIDSYWVHQCVFSARKTLGLKTDKDFYEHILRMIVLSHQRTEAEPELVRISQFVLFGKLLQTMKKDDFIIGRYYNNLEKYILKSDYGKFSFLSEMITFI